MYDLAKAEWLKALRSGNYDQGAGHLATSTVPNTKPAYCCLGVLCEVARKLDANVSTSAYTLVNGEQIHSFDGSTGHLPNSVIQWAGLDSADPAVFDGKDYVPLSVINDDGATFDEIADLIENGLECELES